MVALWIRQAHELDIEFFVTLWLTPFNVLQIGGEKNAFPNDRCVQEVERQ